jgi:predicted nuclease of predicted toxin-antitoxin system
MHLLIDMNLAPNWVAYLRDAGLMAWAREHQAVLMTADLDFSAILAATQSIRPSVIQIRSEVPTTRVVGPMVIDALERLTVEIGNGAIVTLDTSRRRVRILPLLPE